MLNTYAWRRQQARRIRQRGLSVVELMVGVTVGLFVVAAAALMVSGQLADNRNLLLATQIQQDLRSTAEIITRELRRIGFADSVPVWNDTMSGPVAESTVASITPSSGSTISNIDFFYRRRPGDDTRFGFKLESGVIKTKVADAWETLTDARVMRVTAFNIDMPAATEYRLPCAKLCADDTQNCWPVVRLRTATVTITGVSTSDAAITRTITSQVRVRNDWVHHNNTPSCPEVGS